MLEISLVYDKNDKHVTIYDRYNTEFAAKVIKSIELANISNTYSATNAMKFDTSNNTQKNILWKHVAWHCDEYSAAPIFHYINNLVFQKLFLQSDYFDNKYDERVYIDLWQSLGHTNEIEKPSRSDSKLRVTIELKNALTHKMRLQVWRYTNGEYLYMLVSGSLTLKYTTYTIKSQDMHLKHKKSSKKNLY